MRRGRLSWAGMSIGVFVLLRSDGALESEDLKGRAE
jgi:hypothetical protein